MSATPMGSTTGSPSGRSRMVTGLFRDRERAERAYEVTSRRGYGRDDVNLIMSDEARARHFPADQGAETELGTKALEGTGAGAAIGGAVGGVLAAIAAIGTNLVMPGLGLVVAGPLAAALAGAGAGGIAGGLIGALVGWGIPEEHAKRYEEGLKEGGIVMGVTPRSDDDAEYLEREWTTTGEHAYR